MARTRSKHRAPTAATGLRSPRLGLSLGLALAAASCSNEAPPAAPEESTLSSVQDTALPAFEPVRPLVYTAKVKNLLTGQAVTDEEAAAVGQDPAALAALIDTWMKTPEFQNKMFRFFQNAFQQTQLNRQSFADQVPDQGIDARLLDNLQRYNIEFSEVNKDDALFGYLV